MGGAVPLHRAIGPAIDVTPLQEHVRLKAIDCHPSNIEWITRHDFGYAQRPSRA